MTAASIARRGPYAGNGGGRAARRSPGAEPSLVAVLALVSAAVRAGMDIRSALAAVGESLGKASVRVGEPEPEAATALVTVADALGIGLAWDEAWATAPAGLRPVAAVLALAWLRGASPVGVLDAHAAAVLERAQARGRRAAAELGVRLALPVTLLLLPAFLAVGVLPLLIAVAGAVAAPPAPG